MIPPPPRPPLFPYTTLFRSADTRTGDSGSDDPRRRGTCTPPAPSKAAETDLSRRATPPASLAPPSPPRRSEEHTSELQSLRHLVCRLLLEKKKKQNQLKTAT